MYPYYKVFPKSLKDSGDRFPAATEKHNECNKLRALCERPSVPVEFHNLLEQTGRPEYLNAQSSLGPALPEHPKLLSQQEEAFQHRLDSDRVLKGNMT